MAPRKKIGKRVTPDSTAAAAGEPKIEIKEEDEATAWDNNHAKLPKKKK